MPPAPCRHADIELGVSEFGLRNGFKLFKDGGKGVDDTATFPAPLVLPEDILALEPSENHPQSFHRYTTKGGHNRKTAERKTIYLVPPPQVDKTVTFVKGWQKPVSSRTAGPARVSSDGMYEQLMEYMSAFYHGMPVKLYDGPPMKFVRHQGNDKRSKTKTKTPKYVDLAFGGDLVLEIRTRVCPDGVFPRQMNLDDLITVLLNMLPKDAYAIMMIVDHDIWEDDDEIFTAGRAYGGSRVCVVSTARYNPRLDVDIGLDIEHAWPASHCRKFVDQCIAEHDEQEDAEPPAKKRAKAESKNLTLQPKVSEGAPVGHAMRDAINAYQSCWSENFNAKDVSALTRLWLSRVCRTASHELGHCVGIGHCSYYACLMQSTAGLLEDARQPLYLCPVDEAKVLSTTQVTATARDRAMLELMQRTEWKADPTFAALEAWLRRKLERADAGNSVGRPIMLD